MDAVANQVWSVFLFLVDPWHMAVCAAIALVAFYLFSRQLFRAIIFGVSFPGLVAFVSFILALELIKLIYFLAFPPYALLPLLEHLIFPSLFGGFVIALKCISGLLTNKPDYKPNKIYILMLVLQCALSAMTVYMTHFNDRVE